MAAIEKFIKIRSFKIEDTNDMFDEICKTIANCKPIEAKKVVLEMNESDEYLNKYKASLNDLSRLIAFYDIPLEFKVVYLHMTADSPNDESKKKILAAPDNRSEEIQLMEKQSQEIKAPEFKEIVEHVAEVQVPDKKDDIKTVDPNAIPKFL